MFEEQKVDVDTQQQQIDRSVLEHLQEHSVPQVKNCING